MLYDKTYVMNGKQLKNSILQWAIQGKLVPQDPNDEPASVLLDKIRQEKERLIKEKKIKRDKNASIIYRGEDNSYYEKMLATGEVKCIDEEIPFDIPQGWEWCRLGELISYQNGYAYTSSELNKEGKGLPVIKSGNLMTYEVVLKPNNDYVENPSTKMLASAIKKGDLLMCLSSQSDNPEPLGKTAIYKANNTVLLNQRVLKMRPWLEDMLEYMYYAINSEYFHYTVSHQGSGSAQANLKLGYVLSMLIPLAPLKEEIRIVDKINTIMPLVHQYETTFLKQKKLNSELNDRLKSAILQEAIQGKLVSQIASEDTAQELLEQIKAEKQKLVKEGKLKKSALNETVIFRGDDNKYYEQIGSEVTEIELPFDFPNTWSIARLNAVCQLTDGLKTIGKQCLLDAKYLRGKSSETIVEQGKLVYKGDNIMLVDGENSGEVFIVPQDGYMGSTFKRLWISSSMYEPYVLAFTQFYKETLRNSKKGAAIPHLNKELFYGLIIGIPPLQEQIRIVQKLEQSSQLLR